MMKEIETSMTAPTLYFDNSATTPLCAGAKERIAKAIDCFGNPSSLHFRGLEAEKLIQAARKDILASLHAKRGYRLFFTSGGTEANNLAILGALGAKNYKNPKIILTDSEHPCVKNPALALQEKGVEVVFLSTRGGAVDENQLFDALTDNTVLLSVMSVNNETGAVYPVERLFRMAKQKVPGILCHTDAVQAFLKIDFSPAEAAADLVTVSAHKIHGPKGAGALAVSEDIFRRKALSPLLLGGGQEEGLRSGTENTIGICGFGGAAAQGLAGFSPARERMAEIRAYLIANLPDGVVPNLPPVAAPHILSVTCRGIKSETMLHFLSERGICVSSGSACSSHGKHENYVLAAFGLSPEDADCTIRISLSGENTREEASLLLDALADGMKSLVRIKR